MFSSKDTVISLWLQFTLKFQLRLPIAFQIFKPINFVQTSISLLLLLLHSNEHFKRTYKMASSLTYVRKFVLKTGKSIWLNTFRIRLLQTGGKNGDGLLNLTQHLLSSFKEKTKCLKRSISWENLMIVFEKKHWGLSGIEGLVRSWICEFKLG